MGSALQAASTAGTSMPALKKGYATNLAAPTPEYVLGAYHQLWQIEKSFRMSKSDLRARPMYHHQRESIEAHLTIVMASGGLNGSCDHPHCQSNTTEKLARNGPSKAGCPAAPGHAVGLVASQAP